MTDSPDKTPADETTSVDKADTTVEIDTKVTGAGPKTPINTTKASPERSSSAAIKATAVSASDDEPTVEVKAERPRRRPPVTATGLAPRTPTGSQRGRTRKLPTKAEEKTERASGASATAKDTRPSDKSRARRVAAPSPTPASGSTATARWYRRRPRWGVVVAVIAALAVIFAALAVAAVVTKPDTNGDAADVVQLRSDDYQQFVAQGKVEVEKLMSLNFADMQAWRDSATAITVGAAAKNAQSNLLNVFGQIDSLPKSGQVVAKVQGLGINRYTGTYARTVLTALISTDGVPAEQMASVLSTMTVEFQKVDGTWKISNITGVGE